MALSIEEEFRDKREFVRKVLAGDERAVVFFNQSYDAAVARFMKLKETIIEKVSSGSSYDLIFDIEKSRKLLWDLLFLAEIVKYESAKDPVIKQKFEDGLNSKKKLVKFTDSRLSSLLNEEAVEVVPSDNVKTLEDILIEAICILDSLRNSFGHNEEGVNCFYDEATRRIFVKNDHNLNSLNFSFDFSYLADFGNGIKPFWKDKIIRDVVDINHAEIFRKLGFRAKDNLDIFYRTSPLRFNFLLSLVGNNYERLLDLPVILFSSNVSEERINFILDHVPNLEYLNEVPVILFSERCTEERIKTLGGVDTIDFERLKKFPNKLFTCHSSCLTVLNYFFDNGVTLDELKLYPAGLFNVGFNIDKVKYIVELDGEVDFKNLIGLSDALFSGNASLNKLKMMIKSKNDLQYLSKIPVSAFTFEFDLMKWQFLSKFENPLAIMTKLPSVAFTSKCSYKRFCFVIDYFRVENLEKVDEKFFMLNGVNDDKLNFFVNNLTAEEILKLPSYILGGETNTELLKKFYEINKNVLSTSMLPERMFSIDLNIEFIKFLYDIPVDGFDEVIKYISVRPDIVESLNRLPKYIFSIYLPHQLQDAPFRFSHGLQEDESEFLRWDSSGELERFNKIKLIIGEKKNISNLYDLKDFIFDDLVSYERLKYVTNNGTDIGRLKVLCTPSYEDVFNILFSSVSLDKIKCICGEKLDIDLLLKFPKFFLQFTSLEDLKKILDIFDKDPDKLSYLSFNHGDVDKILFFIGEEHDLEKLTFVPEICFSAECSLERIKYIMKLIDYNYDILGKLPKEIFTCHDILVEQMLNDFNDISIAMQKSVFGINDDKIISLVVYVNSLFNVINPDFLKKKEIDTHCFNLKEISGIDQSLIDKTSQNIYNALTNSSILDNIINDFSFTKYVKKGMDKMSTQDLIFAFKEWEKKLYDRLYLYLSDLNSTLLNSSRNASAHIRFEYIAPNVIKMNDSEKKYIIDEFGKIEKIDICTFDADVDCDEFFDFVSSVQDQVFSESYTLDDEVRRSLIFNLISASGKYCDELEFSRLYREFIDKLKTFVDETKNLVISLCYLKEKKRIVNAKAIYRDDMGISFMGSGIQVVSSAVFWSDFVKNNENLEYADEVRQRMK